MKLLTSEWFAPESGDGARFRIRPMTGLEMLEVQQIMAEALGTERLARLGGEDMPMPPDAARVVLRCVEEWDGVEAELSPETVQQLPFPVLMELVGAITDKSMLSGGQEKNSSSQSRSRRTGTPSTAETADGAATATRATRRPSRNGRSTASAS